MGVGEEQAPSPKSTEVVSSRLPREVWLRFWWYCHEHDCNFNSGLKKLIETHPLTADDELQRNAEKRTRLLRQGAVLEQPEGQTK